MFKLFLKLILQKTLPIPLAWGFVYPNWIGDIVFRSVRLGRPAVLEVERVRASFEWSSLFTEELLADELQVTGIRMGLSVDDPTALIRCISGGDCSPGSFCRAAQAAQKAAPQPSPANQPAVRGNSSKQMIRILVRSLIAEEGTLELCRGSERLGLRIISVRMNPFEVPLRGGLSLETELRGEGGDSSPENFHFRARMNWQPEKRTLQIIADLQHFPLAPLLRLFPQFIENAAHGATRELRFSIGPQQIVQEVRRETTVNGVVEFSYDQAPGRWTIKMH